MTSIFHPPATNRLIRRQGDNPATGSSTGFERHYQVIQKHPRSTSVVVVTLMEAMKVYNQSPKPLPNP